MDQLKRKIDQEDSILNDYHSKRQHVNETGSFYSNYSLHSLPDEQFSIQSGPNSMFESFNEAKDDYKPLGRLTVDSKLINDIATVDLNALEDAEAEADAKEVTDRTGASSSKQSSAKMGYK